MAVFERLPGEFVGPNIDLLPKLTLIDPILPTAGALLLVDPTHPVTQWPAGVPALSSFLPNLAATQATAVLGGTPEVRPSVSNFDYADTSFGGAAYGYAERSTKGGLHAAFTQRADTAIQTTKGFGITYPTAIMSYLAANPGHGLYVSMWTRITRISPARANVHWANYLCRNTNATSAYWFAFRDHLQPTKAGIGSVELGRSDPGNILGPRRRSYAATGFTNTWDGGPQGRVFTVGSIGSENSFQNAKGNAASQVFYRAYMEDLTISGRTYAQVDAIDTDLYTRLVTTIGGRYYGDTIATDPNTIP